MNLAASYKSRAMKVRKLEAMWEEANGSCLSCSLLKQTRKLLGESQVSVLTVIQTRVSPSS